MAHPNARLTPHGRRLVVERLQMGYAPAEVAEMMGRVTRDGLQDPPTL